MSIFEALGISVVAGLLVLLMTAVAHLLWWWALENVYLKIACRHLTDISGNWTACYTDPHGNQCYDETELRQYGHKIEGIVHYRIVLKNNGGERRKQFKLRGLLRNDIFSAYYWNVDRRQKGSGAFTLAVSRQGDIMKGQYAWFDVDGDTIEVGDHEWQRA